MKKNWKFVLFFVSAVMIGVINGIFGGGGGLLCVPLFKKMLGLKDKEAHATTTFVMAIISIPTLFVYITTINVEIWVAVVIGVSVVVGGIVGCSLMKKISNEALNFVFIVVVLLAGFKMAF